MTPTWNLHPVAREDLAEVTREAFDLAAKTRHGAVCDLDDKRAALNLLEAASHLKSLALYAERLALAHARDDGASWPALSAAMGVPESTARARHGRLPRALRSL